MTKQVLSETTALQVTGFLEPKPLGGWGGWQEAAPMRWCRFGTSCWMVVTAVSSVRLYISTCKAGVPGNCTVPEICTSPATKHSNGTCPAGV